MFKIEFTATTPDEVAAMADRMTRIAAALSHVQSVSVSDTPAKRSPGRPRKSADPVEAYVAAGGVLPEGVHIGMRHYEQPANEPAAQVEEPVPAPIVEPPATLESVVTQAEARIAHTFAATPASLDDLRAQIRTIAQDRGALWLRPLLEADKVTKVSGLTEATMRAALEAAR